MISPPAAIINGVRVDPPLILAPLAGYTDLPFRLLCRSFNAGLCCSEMISCHGLVYQQKNTLRLLETTAAERPVSFQLFGADPFLMGEAASILSGLPIDIIDINMGCPVQKVVKRGGGAALLRDLDLARRIIEKVTGLSKLPVTVKIRTGWDHNNIVAERISRLAADAGAAAVTLHARTRSQGFGGSADRRMIKKVKEAVDIPVIGNGDIYNFQDAVSMMRETGCDAVMIGRAAIGNPWVFQAQGPPAEPGGRRDGLLAHLALIARYQAPDAFLGRIKNQAGKYFRGLPGAASLRKRIYATRNFAELVSLLQNLQV